MKAGIGGLKSFKPLWLLAALALAAAAWFGWSGWQASATERLQAQADQVRTATGAEVAARLQAAVDQLEGKRSRIALATAIKRASTLVFGTNVARSRLEVAKEIEQLTVGVAHDSLVQVFVNLLQNAADVIEGRPGAQIRVHASSPAGGRVEVLA